MKHLKQELSIHTEDIFKVNGALDLTFLMKIYDMDGFSHLKIPKHTPQPNPAFKEGNDIFTDIRKGDIFYIILMSLLILWLIL